MLNITTLTLLLIISPLISLALTKTSFLMCLLNLEALMLGMITMSFLTNFMGAHTESMNTLLILSLSACEASLGLACLVNIMRNRGNDSIKTMGVIKC